MPSPRIGSLSRAGPDQIGLLAPDAFALRPLSLLPRGLSSLPPHPWNLTSVLTGGSHTQELLGHFTFQGKKKTKSPWKPAASVNSLFSQAHILPFSSDRPCLLTHPHPPGTLLLTIQSQVSEDTSQPHRSWPSPPGTPAPVC